MEPRPRYMGPLGTGDALREFQAMGLCEEATQPLLETLKPQLVKVTDVPRATATLLKQQMLSVGGKAALAVESLSVAEGPTQVALVGSPEQLQRFCQRLRDLPNGLEPFATDLARQLRSCLAPSVAALSGRGVTLDLQRPRIMGILNTTPDSFSDGGCFTRLSDALGHARSMEAAGADLIDVGGQSTRPGAADVSTQQEMDRVLPVIERLAREVEVPLSIDTTKSAVALEAIALGAAFVNDVSGLHNDPEMAAVVAQQDAGLFLMHMRGQPRTMQDNTTYDDLVSEVMTFLHESVKRARRAGVATEKMCLDPGIGFGKGINGNLELLRRIAEFHALGLPLLVGTSRKSFIGKVLGHSHPDERLNGTLATVAHGVMQGVQLFRVHDPGAAKEVAMMTHAILHGQEDDNDG